MSLRSRSARPAEGSDHHASASVAAADSTAACAARSSPAHSTAAGCGCLVSALLWLLHVAYSFVLLWQRTWDCARRWWRLGPRIAVRRIRASIGSDPPQLTPLHAAAFARLPVHLAFSLAPHQLQLIQVSPAAATAATGASVSLSQNQSSSAALAPAATVASSLVASCLQLPLPELTLYDDDDVLSRCWPSVGVRLAALQQSSTSNPSLILVLQGAATSTGTEHAEHSRSSDPPLPRWSASLGAASTPLARAGDLILVHRGCWTVVAGAPFMRNIDAEEDATADAFVDTSRPGVALPRPPRPAQSVTEEGPTALWRTRLAKWVAAHRPRDVSQNDAFPAAADVRLVSFLGVQHSRRAVAQAALQSVSIAASASAAASSAQPHASAACASHDLRLHLQRSLLPLPLSEPELLLCVSGSPPSLWTPLQRSVQGFPPWLLRLCEMAFVSTVQGVTSGYDLQLALMDFAASVQRGGT